MDPKWQALFYALAVLFFLLDAVGWRPRAERVPVWTPLGLACAFFPFLYGAAAAGW
jgi:hypothetical protein